MDTDNTPVDQTGEPIDPNADGRTLAQLAKDRPDLWEQIKAHPACYPELKTWIEEKQAAAPPQPSKLSAEQWSAQFQSEHGREPTMSEYQAALTSGTIVPAGQEDASLDHMKQGAQELAAGAKEYYASHIAPAAVSAGQSVRDQVSNAQTSSNWKAWVPLAIPVLALLGIISLFLPAVSVSASALGYGYSQSVSFFDAGDGGFALVILLCALVAGVVGVIIRTKRARTVATVISIAVGAILVLVSIFYISQITSGVSIGGYGSVHTRAGSGLVMLTIISILLTSAGIVTAVSQRKAPTNSNATS